MANFQTGDIIAFSYQGISKKIGLIGRHDKFPQVLVLHPSWEGLVHGLNFNYLADDEKNVIRMLLDPMFEMKFRDALRSRNPNLYDELEGIITGKAGSGGGIHQVPPPAAPSGPTTRVTQITQPRGFYYNMIRPFIFTRGWDPYRRYNPGRMTNVRIITPARVVTGEESLVKYRKERSELATRARKALGEARTPEDQMVAKEALDKIQRETSMSQRKSLLTWFSERLRYWRGPRFR